MDTTKVIFRKFNDGEIIALFPELPGSKPQFCLSYMFIGQHGDATTALVQCTKPATPEEYQELLDELKAIGYNPVIRKKITKHDAIERAKSV